MSVSTSETREVETVKDIIEGYANNVTDAFTNTPPDVYFYWDIPQNEKDPGVDMPPRVYVWSPTTTDTGMFSADGDEFDEQATVEVQCWSLDAVQARQLQQDITQILSDYFADNELNTNFTDIRPNNRNDFREQANARMTESYILSIEADVRGLRRASRSGDGLAFSFGFDGDFA